MTCFGCGNEIEGPRTAVYGQHAPIPSIKPPEKEPFHPECYPKYNSNWMTRSDK